jgi:hypothetical protein
MEDGGGPHEGAAGEAAGGLVSAGEAGDPQPPALGLAGAGLPHPPAGAGGGATMVGATLADLGCTGGAQVAATPAVWLAGAAGRTGGPPFFLRRRLRVRR